MPILDALAGRPIKADTRKAAIAPMAIAGGAALEQDVFGGCFDGDMQGVVAAGDAAP